MRSISWVSGVVVEVGVGVLVVVVVAVCVSVVHILHMYLFPLKLDDVLKLFEQTTVCTASVSANLVGTYGCTWYKSRCVTRQPLQVC